MQPVGAENLGLHEGSWSHIFLHLPLTMPLLFLISLLPLHPTSGHAVKGYLLTDTSQPFLFLVSHSPQSLNGMQLCWLWLSSWFLYSLGCEMNPRSFSNKEDCGIWWGWEWTELGLLLTIFGTTNKSFHDYVPQSPYLKNGDKTCLPSSSYKDVAKIRWDNPKPWPSFQS